MVMFPDADIPIVEMSINSSNDPAQHLKVGQILSILRQENILLMASGSSFHNMNSFFT